MLFTEPCLRCTISKNDGRSISSSVSHGAVSTTGLLLVANDSKHLLVTNLEYVNCQVLQSMQLYKLEYKYGMS